MGKTAVLGFGNPVRSDDGAGCYVIELLKKRYSEQESFTLLDMGTSAFEVLFQLQGHSKLIFVDAVVNSGEPVGTLFKLPAEAVQDSVIEDPMVFLHSLKWDQALSYAKKILQNDFPEDITVYLISIENIRLADGLSQEVEEAAVRASDLIAQELDALITEDNQ